MRVFKTFWFRKFAAKERISDAALCEAVGRAEAGLVDADLGGGLLRQRSHGQERDGRAVIAPF
jgi:hypothetical protein